MKKEKKENKKTKLPRVCVCVCVCSVRGIPVLCLYIIRIFLGRSVEEEKKEEKVQVINWQILCLFLISDVSFHFCWFCKARCAHPCL